MSAPARAPSPTGGAEEVAPAGRVGIGLGSLLLAALAVFGIHAQSLSGDGVYHLLAGHQALRYGQNTLNLEHPPLAKLAFAAPLALGSEPLAPPLAADAAMAAIEGVHERPALLRRAGVAARYAALVVFGLPFLGACHRLGRRYGGAAAGWTLVFLTAFPFSVLPNLVLLQTDVAAALAFVATVLAGLGFVDRPCARRAALLGLALGLGLAVKFSAVLLLPTVAVSLALGRPGRGGWPRRLAYGALAATIAFAVVDLTYLAANRSYDRAAGREVLAASVENRTTLVVDGQLEPRRGLLLAVERVDPYFAQWLTGLLGHRAQNRVAPYPSYAFGEVFSRGRWWYLPALLALKTPLALLVAAVWALVRARREPAGAGRWALPIVTIAVFTAAYASANYNLGFRHLLPIVPLALLPLALALARRPRVAALVVAVLALESLALAPLWMSATNTWWLGARNPTRFALGTGNVEYRLNFLELGRAARRRGIEMLNVVHPTVGPAVVAASLPGAHWIGPGEALAPGWYAVNVTLEQYVPAILAAPPGSLTYHDRLLALARRWEPTWRALGGGEDHGYVAGSFHLVRLPAAARPDSARSP